MQNESMKQKFLFTRIFFLILVFFTGSAIVITDLQIGIIVPERIFVQMLLVLIVSCIAFYIPVFAKMIRNKEEVHKRRRELRFLKKIFVMCGSVKPVDYMHLIEAMHERAFYYRTDLEQIMDVLQKSSVDKEEFFGDLLRSTEDLDSKLFFEKLSIGFLYDFDLAVASIGADFVQEKRAYARFVKKRVNLIHIIGVAGLFTAITILLLYFLKPWLSSMNLNLF